MPSRERPILFSSAMVRAILDGRKTQTRRVVKDAGDHVLYWRRGEEDPRRWVACDGLPIGHIYCPYGVPGDHLWVRETFWHAFKGMEPRACVYLADAGTSRWRNAASEGAWRPSIHMPRWASRITLEITDVRVQRLQEIAPADAISEGVERRASSAACPWYAHAVEDYAKLWDSINEKRAPWASNPWVWAITFRRMA